MIGNTSGTNSGDQTDTDFDIKDLTDSTSLRSTWSGKADALGEDDNYVTDAEKTLLGSISTDGESLISADDYAAMRSLLDLDSYYTAADSTIPKSIFTADGQVIFGTGLADYEAKSGQTALVALKAYTSQPETPGTGDTITPTAGYWNVTITLVCDDAITALKLGEGSAFTGQRATFINLGSNLATFESEDLVLQLPGKKELAYGDSLELIYLTDMWFPANDRNAIIVQAVERPTLAPGDLSDTLTPHVLTANELKGTKLSNSGATGSLTWSLESVPMEDVLNFDVLIEAAQNTLLKPDTGEQWYLVQGDTISQLAASEGIANVTPTIGDRLKCEGGNTSVFCWSYPSTAFTEETP